MCEPCFIVVADDQQVVIIFMCFSRNRIFRASLFFIVCLRQVCDPRTGKFAASMVTPANCKLCSCLRRLRKRFGHKEADNGPLN